MGDTGTPSCEYYPPLRGTSSSTGLACSCKLCSGLLFTNYLSFELKLSTERNRFHPANGKFMEIARRRHRGNKTDNCQSKHQRLSNCPFWLCQIIGQSRRCEASLLQMIKLLYQLLKPEDEKENEKKEKYGTFVARGLTYRLHTIQYKSEKRE